jgi:glycosyltransferase involved in cell wall biosynthesis
MNDVPLVSVIIPCYRQARYLPEAIDSALAQTHPAVEVLVVNDGSEDDTEAVAGRYGDRIRYLWRSNGGISAARNTGIAHARGSYLKFLDADDYLHPEQIARQVEMAGGRDDVVSFTGVRLFRDGRPEEHLDHVPKAAALLPDLFKDLDWGSILAYLFPARLVREVGGFAEGVHHAEDWDFPCRVGLLDPHFLVDPRIGCYYRQRPRSASADRSAWVRSQGRLVLQLHDRLRASGRRDWFGLDLLKFEQGCYQALVGMRLYEPELATGLLRNIKELQAREGFGNYGWRFRLLARTLGYARAERLRGFVVRTLKIHPPESLDTASWREAAAT